MAPPSTLQLRGGGVESPNGQGECHVPSMPLWVVNTQLIYGRVRNAYETYLQLIKGSGTGISYFTAPCFIVLHKYYIFTNWSFVATLHSASVSTPFFPICAHFMSLCHIVLILRICQTCSLLLIRSGDVWSVMPHTAVVTVVVHHKPCPCKMANLIKKCILIAPPTSHSSISLPPIGPPHFLIQNHIKIRSLNKPTTASWCSSEIKNCTFLTLNKKLEVIKLHEEDMSKAKRGWKLSLLCQTVSKVRGAGSLEEN